MRLRALWLACGWAMVAAIVWLSLTPSPPEIDFTASDKVGHFGSYTVVMLWFAQLYRSRRAWAAGFIALGIGLELVQGALGYRTFDVYDMAANTLGVLLGWAAARALPPLLPA